MSMTINQLKTLSDQLKLKAHLFSAEMRQSWEKVEKDIQLLQSEAKRAVPSAKAVQPLILQVEESLTRIREGIERNHA